MSTWWVLGFSFGYLALLFGIAFWAERFGRQGKSMVANPYVYALSLAVYCTAWTYYGSVGRAAQGGMQFLAVYTGASLMIPLFWTVLRKIIRVSKVQRLSTIADFISGRYGKNISLGILVTVVSLFGIIPYISIQLKAISSSFAVLTGTDLGLQQGIGQDTALYIAIGLAAFTILFGTRTIETTERHEGMVTAIAVESIIKLVAFLSIGLFVTFSLFDGPAAIFEQLLDRPDLEHLLVFNTDFAYGEWFWVNLLSMGAVILLPRQFQVAVVENVNEKHLSKAMWLFPLYLFLINLFVLPIAAGGSLLLGNTADADTYVLALPLAADRPWLALLTYIGGFSAATSMIIVSTIAISTMISNNLLMPLLVGVKPLQRRLSTHFTPFLLYSRRLSIVLVLLLAYAYYRGVGEFYSLVSIGLISFAAVAQFAPAMLGGLYWKGGTRIGAVLGLSSGFVLWFYTLVLPSMAGAGLLPQSLVQNGLFGWHWLRPTALFGLETLDFLSHGMFWSLGANLLGYVFGSFAWAQGSKERNQAEVFVDIFRYSTVYESSIVWKGTAYMPDLRSLLEQFLGKDRAQQSLADFEKKYEIDTKASQLADPRLVTYAEKVLAGVIGTGSARIMVASVVKEEEISLEEVVNILRESQQLLLVNRELRRKSVELKRATQQLQLANNKLLQQDELKDEFLYTVTHELRTPLTSIRALSEILHDNPDIDDVQREQFLSTIVKETERLTRLISQVLDLEMYESGKQQLDSSWCSVSELVNESVAAVQQLMTEKNIQLQLALQPNMPEMWVDRDRFIQVMLNLLGNAIKFVPAQSGRIQVSAYFLDGDFKFNVSDNAKGIDPELQPYIFDKFFQAPNQTKRKPKGSGLGLAISQRIIALHQGSIWVESQAGKGSRFSFTIPSHSPENTSP